MGRYLKCPYVTYTLKNHNCQTFFDLRAPSYILFPLVSGIHASFLILICCLFDSVKPFFSVIVVISVVYLSKYYGMQPNCIYKRNWSIVGILWQRSPQHIWDAGWGKMSHLLHYCWDISEYRDRLKQVVWSFLQYSRL